MTARAKRSETLAAGAARRLPRDGPVLLDTGVLVNLYAQDQPQHRSVVRWLEDFRGELHTVEAVLTETAFFLPIRLRPVIAELAARGDLQVHHLDTAAYRRMAALFGKYADLDPDWADLALVWLAEHTGIRRIATLDVKDFSAYRIHGRKRFELALLA